MWLAPSVFVLAQTKAADAAESLQEPGDLVLFRKGSDPLCSLSEAHSPLRRGLETCLMERDTVSLGTLEPRRKDDQDGN